MELIKCGRRGQITIPRDVMIRLGLAENTPMLLEVRDDGAIVLRQAAVVPIEHYTDARIAEFEREGELTEQERNQARKLIRKKARA